LSKRDYEKEKKESINQNKQIK